jgi:hypothetical protein
MKKNRPRWIWPNEAAQWLALLLRIREVPGSSLGPETGYTDSSLE